VAEPSGVDTFEQARFRFFEGLACFHAGRFAEAESHFVASLAAVPGRPSTLINLAATQLRLSRPQEALAHADAALAVEAESAEAWLHRATALLRLGKLDDALLAFDRLLQIDPGLLDGQLRRAQTLARLGRHGDALAAFDRLLALAPTEAEAWSGRGCTLRELRRFDEAAHSFREALRHGAERELHEYYLASVEPGHVSHTAPRAYVQGLFDDYADDFDAHLVGMLGYRAHRQLVDGLAALQRGPFESAIDVGCGTGLCGPLVRQMVRRLVGLDLSPRMLDKARELGVYDDLEQADGVEYLRHSRARFDLVLAADVLIYVGELDALFAAVSDRMDRGVFCFSVEVLQPGRGDFELLPSLRYAHAEAYLWRLAAAHGFEPIVSAREPVREEQRQPVEGLFVYLGKG
jgi:predicted TPR repeat methyltransferase